MRNDTLGVLLLLLAANMFPIVHAETTRVSANPDGSQIELPPGAGPEPWIPYQGSVISNDGNYVAFNLEFSTPAPELPAERIRQILLLDRSRGRITPILEGVAGALPNATSVVRGISDDGRYIVFRSYATNLVVHPLGVLAPPDDSSTGLRSDLYYYDRLTDKTIRLSGMRFGHLDTTVSNHPTEISSNGQYIGFHANIHQYTLSGHRTPLGSGLVMFDTTTKQLVPVMGPDGDVYRASFLDGISADGRYLLVDDHRALYHAIVYDRLLKIEKIANLGPDGSLAPFGGYERLYPSMSDDGTKVVFLSDDPELLLGRPADDFNHRSQDVYLHDFSTGDTTLISQRFGAEEPTPGGGVLRAKISADGATVSFTSENRIFVAGESGPDHPQTYVYNARSGDITLVSVNNSGNPGNETSFVNGLSSNGRLVLLESTASNLVTDDTNGVLDSFLANWHQIPDADPFESNDEPSEATDISGLWRHYHARCPDRLRGGWDLELACLGIFKDYPTPMPAAPRSSADVWTKTYSELSLHNIMDQDFFRTDFPDPSRYIGSHNVNLDSTAGDSGAVLPMPECGLLQRWSIGPGGHSQRVTVNLLGKIEVSVVPTAEPDVGFPLDPAGESVRLYDPISTEQLAVGDTPPLSATIYCPTTDDSLGGEELNELLVSVGERLSDRPVDQTGNYELKIDYIIEATRGIPGWVLDLALEREVRAIGSLPCSGDGASFPDCVVWDFPPAPVHHPISPRFVDCFADGPGCFDLLQLNLPTGLENFQLQFAAHPDLHFYLYDENGQEIAAAHAIDEAEPVGNAPRLLLDLHAGELSTGQYFLMIEGPMSSYTVNYEHSVGLESLGELPKP